MTEEESKLFVACVALSMVLLPVSGVGASLADDGSMAKSAEGPGAEDPRFALGQRSALPDGFADRLDHTVFSPTAEACSATVELPDGSSLKRGCEQEAENQRLQSQAGSTSSLELGASTLTETPRFWTEAGEVHTAGDAVAIRTHGYGSLAAMDASGETVWERTGLTFFDEWGLEPWLVPFVLLGSAPTNPFSWVSDRAFDTGDLDGDGNEEVVVAHLVYVDEPERKGLSTVTVLDGATGDTLWTESFEGAVLHVVANDGQLILAEETGGEQTIGLGPMGEDGTVSRLHGLTFSDTLTVDEEWTFTTTKQWGRWLDVEPLDEGRIAAAWTGTSLGSSGDHGRVAVIDTQSGEALLAQETQGYPRHLAHDAARDQLVVHEQADPFVSVVDDVASDLEYNYAMRALSIETGAEELLVEREDAFLLSLQVDDADGDGMAEWITADAAVVDSPVNTIDVFRRPAGFADPIESGRIIVVDGDDGEEHWRSVSTTDDAEGPLLTYGLETGEGLFGTQVLTASFQGDGGTELRSLDGGNGDLVWRETERVAFPLSTTTFTSDGEEKLLGITEDLSAHVHDVAKGVEEARVPLFANAFAAQAADVDDDGGKELLLGTASGGIFAADPSTLELGERPSFLWRATVDDSVRELVVDDVTGDGSPEVVAAATTAVHVLSVSTGEQLYQLDYEDEFVWTITTGDLDADGDADIVVPTGTLGAHDGEDGTLMWRYDPADPPWDPNCCIGSPVMDPPDVSDEVTTYFSTTVIEDGKAVAAYNVREGVGRDLVKHAVAVEGATGDVAWEQEHIRSNDITRLWRSVAILPGQGLEGGDAVGISYDARLTPPAIGWSQSALVYDLETGELLWEEGPLEHGWPHEQTFEREGDLLHVSWATFDRFRENAPTQVGWESSAFTAAFADFGQAGEFLVAGSSTIKAYPSDVPWEKGPDEHIPSVASWSSLHGEELLVVDLDGDGIDEVVSYKQDAEARSQVAAFEGTGRFSASWLPFGVAILEGQGSS